MSITKERRAEIEAMATADYEAVRAPSPPTESGPEYGAYYSAYARLRMRDARAYSKSLPRPERKVWFAQQRRAEIWCEVHRAHSQIGYAKLREDRRAAAWMAAEREVDARLRAKAEKERKRFAKWRANQQQGAEQ